MGTNTKRQKQQPQKKKKQQQQQRQQHRRQEQEGQQTKAKQQELERGSPSAAQSNKVDKVLTQPIKHGQKQMEDWIISLAKNSVAASSDVVVPSKIERLKRRQAKKARRHAKCDSRDGDLTNLGDSFPKGHERNQEITQQEIDYQREQNKKELEQIASVIQTVCSTATCEALKKRPQPYMAASQKKKKRNKRVWDENSIQPKVSSYGGIGLARKSLFLPFQDPSFFPKLEEEFAEHIPGFFGKQRTKAMKRQLDGNMLWRQLAEKKTKNAKLNGIKLSDMSPDDRVEAMIKLGMI